MNEMIRTLDTLCSFRSVAERTDDAECPYGSETRKALDYMLGVCSDMGFRVKNSANRIGYAEIGEGEDIFGILVHLDVVPVGEGWTHEPWGAFIGDDGMLYGRGVVDDKGPAVASVYAMKDVLESGRKLRKRIRIIFGQTEEAGDWTDMKYYKEHEELPTMGITPDAEFPAIYGEKGILHITLSMDLKKSGFIEVRGGQAPNMVADEASARIACDGVIRDFYEQGRAAHGSKPQDGKNAISMLMREVGDASEECRLADFYNRYIGFDIHGERLGIDMEDEQSGRLTLNVGKITTDGERVLLFTDIRHPVTKNAQDIIAAVREKADKYDIGLMVDEYKPPVYMDKDGEFIKTLTDVFEDVTGLREEALVIGGGTYARAMDNIVAFGPMLPGREATEHRKDERISCEDFLLLREIYKEALLRICAE